MACFSLGRLGASGDGGGEDLDDLRVPKRVEREYFDISDGGAKCSGPKGEEKGAKEDMFVV